MIEFRIDAHSGVATYLQLVRQVEHALRLGILRPGDQLPTVREVVAKLAINPNTVLKAYRELERDGLVGGRPGQGTFVLRSLAGPALDRHAALQESLRRWLNTAQEAGLDRESIVALVTMTLREAYEEDVA